MICALSRRWKRRQRWTWWTRPWLSLPHCWGISISSRREKKEPTGLDSILRHFKGAFSFACPQKSGDSNARWSIMPIRTCIVNGAMICIVTGRWRSWTTTLEFSTGIYKHLFKEMSTQTWRWFCDVCNTDSDRWIQRRLEQAFTRQVCCNIVSETTIESSDTMGCTTVWKVARAYWNRNWPKTLRVVDQKFWFADKQQWSEHTRKAYECTVKL